uniref:Chloroplast protein-transporting ATPase n=1 Tax=Panagrolaimus davidi TaxID=227884 RepID=A0A914PJU6_9BILA
MDISDQKWNRLNDKSKNLIKFWCNTLINRFGLEYIQHVKNEIVEFIGYKKDIIGRFIHRLCEDHTFSIESPQALKNLFEAVLECLDFKNINASSPRYKFAKKLLNDDKSVAREFEDVRQLCEKLNRNGYTELLEDVLQKLSNDLKENVTARIALSFQFVEEKLDLNLDINLEDCQRKFENDLSECSNEIDEDLYYLQVVDAVIDKICQFRLRHTQKIAVLCALKHYNFNGILQQISTGEGKTLIIAVIGIISVLKGRTVNIVTSSSVLARRDVSNFYCSRLYKGFGLKVDHICYDSARFRKRIYSKYHIVYGDLTSYQRDFLMDNFYSTNVSSSRKFDIMIVDEVDSLFLDNGLNTLYLSHNIAGFEMLYPLIVHLWDAVMNQIKRNGKCKSEKFYQSLCKQLFPIIPWNEILERYSKCEIEIFKSVLIENSVIDEKSNILVKKRQYLLKKFEKIRKNFEKMFDQVSFTVKKSHRDGETTVNLNAALISSINNASLNEGEMHIIMLKENGILDENNKLVLTTAEIVEEKLKKIKERFYTLLNQEFLLKYDEIMETISVDIPRHLRSYVTAHLKEFIENAEIAYNMEEDVEYQIDMRFTEGSQKIVEPKIIITDRDTGVDLPSTQWHKGLHQFLQLKHGLRLTPLSTKAVFISNISYLKKFKCIYGLSGTLGSDTEKQQLQEFYNLQSTVLPSSMVKQFYEEQSIITATKKQHYQEIFNAIKEKMAEGRSVLIIADSSKEVSQITKKVKQLAKLSISDEEIHPYENAVVYKHDSDKFHYSDGNHKLDKKMIIFATNLAGRGTDILLTDELKDRGGLHVIISFLPRNIRIEEQAFGRAARCGERGTAQVIICDTSIADPSSANIVELKGSRDAVEEKRIRKIRENYESKLKVEEDCFQEFNVKLKSLKEENDISGKNKSIIMKNILDNWALFLDQSEYEINGKENRIRAVKDFCEKLRIDDNDPLLPQNMLLLAITKITEARYSEALKSLKKIGESFPEYLPETQYYSFYIAIKDPRLQDFEEGKRQLYDARTGFSERQEVFSNHNDIVERHKIVEENSRLERDIFLQQQKESTFLIKRVIDSIDILFGQILQPDSFANNKTCTEASMHLFELLSDKIYFKQKPPICGLQLKQHIDDNDLTNYCKFNGLNFDAVKTNFMNLKMSDSISIKDLQNALNTATWECLWKEMIDRKVIKQKLTFGLAFKILQNNLSRQKSLIELLRFIPNFIEPDEMFTSELIYNGILESTNVSFNNLTKLEEAASLMDTIQNRAVSVSTCLKKTQAFIDDNFGKENAKLFSFLKEETVTDIMKSHASIDQKYNTVNVTLDRIKQRNSQENNHLMITHGLMYFISCSDTKWSYATLAKCTAVTAAGITQLAFGGYFAALSSVEKTKIAEVLVLEGISDITYGIKGFYQGRCPSYAEHKIKSVGFSTAVSTAKMSTDLIKSASIFKNIITSSRVQKITKALPIISAFSAFDINKWAPENYQNETYFVVDDIIENFKTLLHATFKENNNDIRNLLIKGIQVIGAENLINKEGIFKTYIQPPLFDVCFFMASHLRKMIVENKEITTKTALKSAVLDIITSSDSSMFLGKLSKNMQSIIDYCKKDLCGKLNESIGIEIANSSMIEKQVDAFINQWKGEIEEKATTFLNNHLNNPLSLDENDTDMYQKQLYFIASNAYFNLKKHVSVKALDEDLMEDEEDEETEDDASKTVSKLNEFKINYYAKMDELQKRARNPLIYASALNQSSNVGYYGSEALSRLFKSKLGLAINVTNNIDNENGENNILIRFNCADETENETLFDQLNQKIPELKTHFPNSLEFVPALAGEVSQILEILHDLHIK